MFQDLQTRKKRIKGEKISSWKKFLNYLKTPNNFRLIL